MDNTSSKNRSESPGAGSSGSGSSPKRRSARLSGRVVASTLQKQVTTKNFLGPQIKETPRTLLEGFASKQRDEVSLVKSDKTLELSASTLESTKVLDKSRERQNSFHEESFLHPSQQQASLSSGRKRRTAPDDVPVKKSPKKMTDAAAVNRNWRRPKPIDHFMVRRQSREAIEAAIVGGSSPRDLASRQSPNAVANRTDEEEKELEFTEASINTTTISGIGFSQSRKAGTDEERGEEADVEGSPSQSETQTDMETEKPETEKNVENDANSRGETLQRNNVGTPKREASQRNSFHQRQATESRSAFNFIDDLHTSETGETLSTQQLQSSARKSVTASRLSLGAQHSTVTDPRLSTPVATPPVQMPQLHAQVRRLSTHASELSPQAQQLSLSMPKLSVVVEQLRVPVQQSASPMPQLSIPEPLLSVPAQQSGSPVPKLSTSAPQLSVLSAVPEEFSVTSRNELATTSRAGVAVTLRMEVATIPTMEVVASTPTMEIAPSPTMDIALREQASVASVVDNAGVEETCPSTSQVEEEETREEAAEPTTPRLPWTPRLPPKAKRPISERKTSQSAVVDIQPETSAAAKSRSRGAAVASRGRQRGSRVPTTIPRTLQHSAFQFFAGMKVSKEALEEVDQISEMFWSNVVDDLETYAKHGKHSIVERSDIELLMKRQRFVTENTSLNALIEKYLALEDRETLIPIARAGNRLE